MFEFMVHKAGKPFDTGAILSNANDKCLFQLSSIIPTVAFPATSLPHSGKSPHTGGVPCPVRKTLNACKGFIVQ
jgi:hypothetical protein